MRRVCAKVRVDIFEKIIDGFSWVGIRPMIDEFLNRQLRSERAHAAEVIIMPMRCDQMVDFAYARVSGSRHNARGIALSCGWRYISGIDQDGFTRRCNEQRSIAAFDIDYIDV